MKQVRSRPKPATQQCAPGRILPQAEVPEPPKLRSLQSAAVAESVSCRCRLLLVHPICGRVAVAAIQKGLHPKLKCQKLPDLHGPVLCSAAVLINECAHDL